MRVTSSLEKSPWYTLPPFPTDQPAVHLTLLVPELIWPEPGDQLTLGRLPLPGLEWFAAHTEQQHAPRLAFEDALASCFGLNNAPFGVLRMLGEAPPLPPEDGIWLCADPVHLRFHHERIVLADAGAFSLTEEETSAIIASLNAEFADIGEFHATDARRWYLRLKQAVAADFAPLSAIAGRRLDGELNGQDNPLRRWLNEVQMFLHGHPVNAARQAAGHPAINSLWLWGLGVQPNRQPQTFKHIWGDNPLVRGLAENQGIPRHGLPAHLHQLLQTTSGQDDVLIVLDSLLGPVLYENGDDWRQAAEALDRDWLQPARAALGKGIDSVTLLAPTAYGLLRWQCGAGERWKFWKKTQPIDALAKRLAEGTPA